MSVYNLNMVWRYDSNIDILFDSLPTKEEIAKYMSDEYEHILTDFNLLYDSIYFKSCCIDDEDEIVICNITPVKLSSWPKLDK